MSASKAPASQRAEESVIGTLMRPDDARLEIIGSLDAEQFYFRPYRTIFEEISHRFYDDEPIDPLTIAEAVGPKVAAQWKLEEREAVDRVVALAKLDPTDTTAAREHVKIIRRHHGFRELLSIASKAAQDAIDQDQGPEEIAGALSAAATRLVTSSMAQHELIPYADLGRRWMRAEREEIAAREAGVELGAYFGIPGIDSYVKGLRPTELMMLGGAPGIGKSALVMAMLRNFALRQMRNPPERRVGALFLCLEMGEKGSSDRWAQFESSIDGERLRVGNLTMLELREIGRRWATNRDLPIVANFSGELRETQIKALCVDAIRRHKVGLVVIDHFRFIRTDERFERQNEADDQIVKFLKATLAKDLNLAVICLAHTVKSDDDRRPTKNDLRGSGMISALADIVCLPFSPWRAATQEQRERGVVAREEVELIFDKLRASADGTGEVWMDLSRMSIR